jgi:glycosyltransferase involved in cell wall biosynthesis
MLPVAPSLINLSDSRGTPLANQPPDTGRRLRVGMVLDQGFPPDARVEREATALVQNGYEVHILCLRQSSDQLSEVAYRGLYIHRMSPNQLSWQLPFIRYETRLPYHGIIRNAIWQWRTIDTVWYTLIDRFVKHYGLDVLHIHDLRLLHTGLSVGKRWRIPVVADLHENYPALMEMMKGRHDYERGLKQRDMWEDIESNGVLLATQTFVVTEEAKVRLMAKGLPGNKIHVIANTVDVDKFLAAPIDGEVIRRFKPDFVICYVGHLNDLHRGIQTVLEAMALLKDEIPSLRFIGAGALRPAYKQILDDLIAKHGLENYVHLTDRLDESQFASYIEASDICLCPHLANDQTNATFPNKVYLYHLFKKPIIASNATPLQRYIKNTDGGLVFKSGDAAQLADKIRLLYKQPDLRREMGKNGHQAVMHQYNWPRTARTLIALYDQVVEAITAPV